MDAEKSLEKTLPSYTHMHLRSEDGPFSRLSYMSRDSLLSKWDIYSSSRGFGFCGITPQKVALMLSGLYEDTDTFSKES